MKNILLFFFILVFVSCKQKKENIEIIHEQSLTDNIELIEIYKNDQSDRMTDNINWSKVIERDSLRRIRIYQLLDSSKVRTSKDYHNAAMIFQHGGDSTSYGMAVKLMRKSIKLDSTADKWLLAAAIDRYLLSKNEPQIYGTQYQKLGKDEPWKMGKMDTTKISDAERIEYGVETLAQQRDKLKQMNKKKLSELVYQKKSIDEIISIIKLEVNSESKYDISESGINSFGYDLLGQEKNEDALKIFKLNTELYPNAFNTWDSLGECLISLGRKEEGVKAYKKSLKLNPKNKHAETIISENE